MPVMGSHRVEPANIVEQIPPNLDMTIPQINRHLALDRTGTQILAIVANRDRCFANDLADIKTERRVFAAAAEAIKVRVC